MYRTEYPRPDLVREKWLNLNGQWAFEFDDKNRGIEEQWFDSTKELSMKIEVPFAFQSKNSGIYTNEFHDYVWYKRKIAVPDDWRGETIILHFGAVDYQTKVYVNGLFVGEHIGGHTSFSFDITNYLNFQKDELTVYVFDPSEDERIPRGKQYWKKESRAIWYTRTTGIWQTVWLEPVSKKTYIENLYFTPNFDEGEIKIDYQFVGAIQGKKVKTIIKYDDQIIIEDENKIYDTQMIKSYYLFNHEVERSDYHGEGWTWTPDTPNLYDVTVTIFEDQEVLDKVDTYFGMRKVHTVDGMVFLNNRPYYQKLVLDQGYWPDGLMTAVTDEEFKRDIELAKKMGFNGCRKHQKVEDPRFLYWADKLGFIVWGECASPSVYSEKTVGYLTNEWLEIIKRDYNHPCILTWVPINESWGVPEISVDKRQQHFSQAIYHLIHSLDKTRLVISNDGWEMTETDICAIHSYVHGTKEETRKYTAFKESLKNKETILSVAHNRRSIYNQGFTYQGEPILLTEFGGIGFDVHNEKGWGYTTAFSKDDFISEYKRVMEAVFSSEVLHGFCYTQLTDVEQEMNGLLTYDRQEKVPLEEIKKINQTWHPSTIKPLNS
ncbi:hypothetical protein IGI37_000481 [Enterococcus sp. AZ194]|uniref:glycoside hydrolase family 2 protein n=1 Tax=Enterococcus sp. AZ194 TaxID=2774629 RepID=UPI003F21C77F